MDKSGKNNAATRGTGSEPGDSDPGHSFISSRAPTMRDVTDNHVVMTWDRFVGVVWKRDTTLQGVAALTKAYTEQAASFPTGVYLLTVVEPSAPLPDPETREALAVFLRSGAGRTRMSAVVHEGAGFRAAAVRSVVTGLAMLVRLPYPHEIFATVEQAARWLATTKYKDVDPDYTLLAVNDGRRAAMSQKMFARGK